jgi:hypothetical protein
MRLLLVRRLSVVELDRAVLFRLATSERLERAVKTVPLGEAAAWRAASPRSEPGHGAIALASEAVAPEPTQRVRPEAIVRRRNLAGSGYRDVA